MKVLFSSHRVYVVLFGVLVLVMAIFILPRQFLSADIVSTSPLHTPQIPTKSSSTASMSVCHQRAIAHVARTYDLREEMLVVGDYIEFVDGEWLGDGKEIWMDFPYLQRRVCSVAVTVKDSGETYKLAIDEQGVIVDVEELQKLEGQLAEKRCGKQDTVLCARLPELLPDETIEVAIWLRDIDRDAIYDAVAAQYSGSLQKGKGVMFDANDPAYEQALREAELRIAEAYESYSKPILSFLASEGFEASYTSKTTPVVFVQLTADMLSKLVEREDVVRIYLLEGELRDQSENQLDGDQLRFIDPTIRVSTFWDAGYTGTGIDVATVEDDPVDFGNSYLDHAEGETGPPQFAGFADDMEHPTLVAGVVAMDDHPLYRGVASNVTLHSADAGTYDPQNNIAEASDWAIHEQDIDVLNCSFGQNTDGVMGFWDQYYDHVVWHDRRLVVFASGNRNDLNPLSNVESPGLAYNVLTVGGINDQLTATWVDDEMWSDTCFRMTDGRNKPELTAVAHTVCTTSHNEPDETTCHPLGGTSFAAPQVTGLAALLMEKTGLTRHPELMKAIIMASAVHNIEGSSRLSDADGVGGIDANLAYKIADHGRYGIADEGWYDFNQLFYGDFDAQGEFHYNVPLSKGEKVRAVLVYSSHPDVNDPYNNDQLLSDLDLKIYRPSGNLTAQSQSPVNNFEIVEFIAPESGAYDFRIKRFWWDPANVYEHIGLAWVREATYLSTLRNNSEGISAFYIRNDGALTQDIKTYYFNPDGSYRTMDSCNGLAPNQWCYIRVNELGRISNMGSAIVSGAEDVSVIVQTKDGSGDSFTVEGYVGIQQAGFESYLSTLGGIGWESSEVGIVNVGTSANVFVNLYNRDGDHVYGPQLYQLDANERLVFDAFPVGFLGSAFITSNRPVVADATTFFAFDSIYDTAAYEGFASGSPDVLYFPQVKRRLYGGVWYDYSGIVIQDLEDSDIEIRVSFYPRGQDVPVLVFNDTIPGRSSHGYNTQYGGNIPATDINGQAIDLNSRLGSAFNGSVKVEILNVAPGRQMIGTCKTWIYGDIKAWEIYSGQRNGSIGVMVPLVFRKTYTGQFADMHNNTAWDAYSGVVVQNLHPDRDAEVSVHFYRSDGVEVPGAFFEETIAAGNAIPPLAVHGYNTRYIGNAPPGSINALGYDFQGSMFIESTNNCPLMVLVDNGFGTQAVYYYNAVHR